MALRGLRLAGAMNSIGGSSGQQMGCRTAAMARPLLSFLASFSSESAAQHGTSPQKYLQTLVKINYEAGSDRRDLKVASKGSDRGDVLATMRRFLKDMNEPQSRFPVVHVVGSKGKGSTSALLTSILSQAGLRVGTYTSPHVISLGERIQINGRVCEKASLLEHFQKYSAAVRKVQEATGWKLSYFEALTGLAFQYFADNAVDVAVVEAGLGGTNDATNVFSKEQLKLVVVTLLEKEHTEVLGETIPEIVKAKMGVVKEGTPVVVARQSLSETEQLIAESAKTMNCGTLMRVSQICKATKKEQQTNEGSHCYTISTAGRVIGNVSMEASPAFMLDNLRSAVVSAEFLAEEFGITLNQESIQKAMAEYSLPGRFQIIPARSEKSNGEVVILDGAHTSTSAKALVDTLLELYVSRGYKIKFVVAMAKDKEVGPFMQELSRANPSQVVCTVAPFDGNANRSCAPEQLVDSAKACGLPAAISESGDNFKELLQRMETDSSEEDTNKSLVCFTGSFRIVELYLRSKAKI